MSTWADRINALLENLNLSNKEFAALLQISGTVVWRWATGRREGGFCWERVIQFLEDCPSGVDTLRRLDLDGHWPTRIEELLHRLGWDGQDLVEFFNSYNDLIFRWRHGGGIDPCYRIAMALLEVYADVPKDSWPVAIYTEPHDFITPERIKLLRQSLAMRQSDLASLVHIRGSSISNMETWEKNPGWCSSLLLRILETFPRAADLLSKITQTDERISADRARNVREHLELTPLQFSHLVGLSHGIVNAYERDGLPTRSGCAALVYLLLEQHTEEFVGYIHGLSSPGGQACPIW